MLLKITDRSKNLILFILRVLLLIVILLAIFNTGGFSVESKLLIDAIIFFIFFILLFTGLLELKREFLGVIFFLLYNIIILPFSVNIYNSVLSFFDITAFFLLVFISYKLFDNFSLKLIFSLVIVELSLVICLYSFVLFFYTGSLDFSSFFAQRDVTAAFLLLVIFFNIHLFLYFKDLFRSSLWFVSIFILLFALIYSYSRASFLVFVIAGSIYLYMIYKMNLNTYFKKFSLLFLLLAIALTTTFFVVSSSNTKLLRNWKMIKVKKIKQSQESKVILDSSISARLDFWRGALEIGKANFFGTGLNTFYVSYPFYQQKFYFYSKDPHNFYLRLFSETGFIGLILFILSFLFLYMPLKDFKKVLKSIPLNKRLFLIGLIISTIAGFLHIAFDVDMRFAGFYVIFAIEIGFLANFLKSYYKDLKFNNMKKLNVALILFTFVLFLYTIFNLWAYREYKEVANSILDSMNKHRRINEKVVYRMQRLTKLNFISDRNYRLLARVYLINSMPIDKVIMLIKKAIYYNRRKALYYNYLGNLYFKKHDLKKSLDNLKKAVYYDPQNYPSFYIDLAKIKLYQGKENEALDLLVNTFYKYNYRDLNRLQVFRKPKFISQLSTGYSLAVKLALNLSNKKLARQLIEDGLKISPENYDLKFYYALVFLIEKSKWKKAIKILSNYINSNNFEYKVLANYFIGVSYYELRDYKKAQDFLKYSLYLAKDNVSACIILAKIYIKLKEYKAALFYIKKGLSLEKNNLQLKKLLNEVKNLINE